MLIPQFLSQFVVVVINVNVSDLVNVVENATAVTDVIVLINVCVWENANVVKSANVNINALAKVNADVVQIAIVL